MSLTLQGLLVTMCATIIRTFELDLDEGEITEVVASIGLVAGFITTYVGRVRQGDLTWYGKKKW